MIFVKSLKTLLLIFVIAVAACTGQNKSSFANTSGDSGYSYDKADLVGILDTIFRLEQEPLTLRDEAMKKYGDDSEEFVKYQTIYEKNHEANEVKILAILEGGWPDNDVIGERGDGTICNVLQHCSQEVREQYIPMMKQAVLEDKLNPQFLVRAEDRLATDRGELQIYGGQMKYYPDTKSFNVWPVYDPVNIDKRRAEIGLGPIAEHLMNRFEFEWILEDQIQRSNAFTNEGINKS